MAESEFPFVGRPKKAEDVEREGRQRYQWAEIFAAIKPGEARQVKIKFDVVKAAIHRTKLEDEYRVISRNRATWIIRKPRE